MSIIVVHLNCQVIPLMKLTTTSQKCIDVGQSIRDYFFQIYLN